MEKTKTQPPEQPELHGLHQYTKGEEIVNVLTHGAGALFGIFVLIFGIIRSVNRGAELGILAAILFAIGIMVTYGVSTVYHALKPGKAKKILRVIDHCTVYVLIAGTYSAITLTAILPYAKTAAIIVLSLQWSLGALAIILTAVNMKKFRMFSFICYIVLGWMVIAIPHIIVGALTVPGFLWLLFGGIAYTIGSVLYAVGRKKKYMHGIFHIFTLLGTVLHFVCFALLF
jgi:hemolysin III